MGDMMELARRVVAAPGWRWMPGMLWIDVVGDGLGRVGAALTRAQRRAEEASRLREGRRRARAARWVSPRMGLWLAERNGAALEVEYETRGSWVWGGRRWLAWVTLPNDYRPAVDSRDFMTVTQAQRHAVAESKVTP
jgi:hypothetical protein